MFVDYMLFCGMIHLSKNIFVQIWLFTVKHTIIIATHILHAKKGKW
jgi:hypothetical protein